MRGKNVENYIKMAFFSVPPSILTYLHTCILVVVSVVVIVQVVVVVVFVVFVVVAVVVAVEFGC